METKQTKIGFKFVDRVCDRLLSWTVPKHFRIEYKENEWIKPSDGSPLFLFDSEEDARQHSVLSKLYRCLYVPYHRQDFDMIPNAYSAMYADKKVLDTFWKDPSFRDKSLNLGHVIKGTVFASEVKLLELLPTPDYDNYRKP